MKRTTFMKSLMAFNQRVLSQGKPKRYSTVEELREALFFNNVALSNCDEIFEKYDGREILYLYHELLKTRHEQIIEIISMLDKIDTCVNYYTNTPKCCNDKAVWNIYYGMVDNIKKACKVYTNPIEAFDQSDVEYVFVGMNLREEHEPYYVTIDQKFINELMYICIDTDNPDSQENAKFTAVNRLEYIRHYISETYGPYAVICRITRAGINCKFPKGYITKVEIDSDIDCVYTDIFEPRESMDHHYYYIKKYIGDPIHRKYPAAAFVHNSYMNTYDLESVLDKCINHKEEVQNESHPIALDTLDKDILLEYPNDSFKDYLSFLKSAANNKECTDIYMTIYRIGNDSNLFNIMQLAIDNGIDVHANIELCARGEEVRNLNWGKKMKEIGVDVTTYECGKLKVHAKLTLVKFNNGRSVAQIGTGNYHTKTTSQYTDLCLITADEDICSQVEKVFQLFHGDKEVSFNDNLLITGFNTREILTELIEDEASKGTDGYICIKCNALSDEDVIYSLECAAKKGVQMDLIIRGVCTWIPNYPNVCVKSIVWDKLEHSRVYCFGNTNPEIYLGSLDLVKGKLDKRIESLVRINDCNTLIKIVKYLNRYITSTNCWLLQSDGSYIKEE